jgi:hypothetical protein
MSDLSLQKLRLTLKEYSDQYRQLSQEDVFTLWLLRAYVTPSIQQAAAAVVGGKGDKSYDAILMDDGAKTVFVIQTKYRATLNKTNEKRNDLVGFADIANQLSNASDRAFKQYCDKMDELTAGRAIVGRKRILRDKYRLHLLFVMKRSGIRMSFQILTHCFTCRDIGYSE